MKKLMKRIIALMTAGLITVTVSGCGQKEVSSTNGTSTAGETDGTAAVSKEFLEQLKGTQITIAYPDKMRNPGQNPQDDEWAMLLNKVGTEYGVTIKENYYTNKENGATFIADSLSGNNLGNIEIVFCDSVFRGVQKNAWADLDKAATEAGISFDSKHYYQPSMKAAHINGAHYGLSFKTQFIQTDAVYYNVNMVTVDNKLEDPLDLYNRGEWTFDKFEEYCKKLTKKDANGDITVYGCQMEANASMGVFVQANGGSVGRVNADGKWQQTLSDKKTLNGYNFVQKLFNQDQCIYVPSGSWGTSHKNLYAGNCAMQIGASSSAFDAYLQQKDEGGMGFVPLPLGPDGTKEDLYKSSGGFFYVIPAAYQKDAAKYLFIIDEVSRRWYEMFPEIYKKQYTAIFKQDKYMDAFYDFLTGDALTGINEGCLCLVADSSGYSQTLLSLEMAKGVSVATAVDKFATAMQNEHNDQAGDTLYTGFSE